MLRRRATALILLLYALLCSRAVSGCTRGFMQLELLKERAEKISNGNAVSDNFIYHGLRVIPGLNFTCNGTIISAMVGVDVRTGSDGRVDYPQVDVWRADNSNDFFRIAPAVPRDVALNPGDFSPDGVLQYNLTNPASFQSGDFLGIYQPPSSDSIVRMYFDHDSSAPYAEFNNASNGFFGQVLHSGASPELHNQHVLITVTTDPPGCTSTGFLTPEELRQKTHEVNINRVITRDRQQRMFPEIKFTCSGSITKWIVGAGTGGGSTPPSELQIWRRSGSDYTKMGSTQLTAQSPTNDDPNVYEYTLSMPLEFQEGDFLGVYQRDGSSIVPYYQENTGPQNFRQSGQANSAPNSLTSPPLAAEYDYPLVSVEIAGSLSTSLPQKVPSSTMQQDEQEATPTVSTFTGMMTSLQPSAVSNAASQASTTPSIQTVQDNTILYIAVALIVGAILIVAVTIIAVVMGIFIWKRRNSKKAQNSELKHNSYLTTSFNKDEQEHIVIASHISQDSGPAMKLQQNECYDTVLNLKTNEPTEPMYEDLDSVVPKPKPDQDNSDLYYI